jgi:hypothetical protein
VLFFIALAFNANNVLPHELTALTNFTVGDLSAHNIYPHSPSSPKIVPAGAKCANKAHNFDHICAINTYNVFRLRLVCLKIVPA